MQDIRFLEQHDADAWAVMAHHVAQGNLIFIDDDSRRLAEWRVEQIIRTREISDEVKVRCTDRGAESVV